MSKALSRGRLDVLWSDLANLSCDLICLDTSRHQQHITYSHAAFFAGFRALRSTGRNNNEGTPSSLPFFLFVSFVVLVLNDDVGNVAYRACGRQPEHNLSSWIVGKRQKPKDHGPTDGWRPFGGLEGPRKQPRISLFRTSFLCRVCPRCRTNL